MITDEMLRENIAEARDLWLSSLPRIDDLPTFVCSRRFQKRMKRLLAEQRRSPVTIKLFRIVRSVAAILIAAAIFAFGGFMSVEANRIKVFEMIEQVFEKFTHYQFTTEILGQESVMISRIEFGYVPAGMAEQYNAFYGEKTSQIRYSTAEGDYFVLNLRYIGEGAAQGTILDTEGATQEKIVLRSIEAVKTAKGEDVSLLWIEDGVKCFLYGNVETEKLIRIAEAIRFVQK